MIENKYCKYFIVGAFLLLTLASCLSGKRLSSTMSDNLAVAHLDVSEMRLKVDGTSLVNHKDEKVVLRGVSLGWHNWHSRFYTPSVVKYLSKKWGVTVVRAAMGVEPYRAYLKDSSTAVSLVTSVADAAIEAGIYVIIDWHSHKRYPDEAKAFFRQMATRYKGVPNVIYEIYNEPIDDTWQEVKKYAEEVIQSIRSIDANALILVGTPHWDQDVHIAADDPIAGYNNVMYSLHFYADSHREKLRQHADYALKKGLPIFVSECAGMHASGGGEINIAEWNRWQEWMQRRNISWVAWSVSDKRETCSMFLPDLDYKKDNALSPWGRIIKKEMHSHLFEE